MNKILYGKSVILRDAKESDIDDRFKIGRNNEFEHMCGGEVLSEPIYPDRAVWENWYQSQKNKECAWIIEYEGKCIGGAELHHISKQDKSATYAIGIFDVTKLSMGIGTEVTKLILQYGFEQLKLHRIDLKVLDYNKRGIRCYEKCGFKVDGILRESGLIGGSFYSDIIMSILDYEWENITEYKIKQILDSIAPCGLVCKLCHLADSCDGCKSDNNCCGLRKMAEGCYQYNCCEQKGIDGCWDCNIAPCDKGMFSESHDIRLRAFITYIKQNGKEKLANRLYHNVLNGIYYGHSKDYDNLGSVGAVIERIEGK